ncbi:MAG: hypothetical protein ACRDL2_03995 [Gaiellaceae bacterium]
MHRLSFDHTPKELALRHSGTVEITLLWSKRRHRAAVTIEDAATGELIELPLAAEDDPLDVYNHPYVYAAARGLLAA